MSDGIPGDYDYVPAIDIKDIRNDVINCQRKELEELRAYKQRAREAYQKLETYDQHYTLVTPEFEKAIMGDEVST